MKKMKKTAKIKKILFSVLCLLMPLPLLAMNSFVVREIAVKGLQRISVQTVESYLPLRDGQTLTAEKSREIIAALYETGFFERISLSRTGNVLVIRVVERPTVGKLKITGNSAIPTDRLTSVMKNMGVAEGRVYDSVTVDRIRQGLLNQYQSMGRYNATVDVTVSPMPQNRVQLSIRISEGLVAKVRRINIIGAHAFSEWQLRRQFDLGEGMIAMLTLHNRFSSEKFQKALENLRNYYMDRGYLKFRVKSSSVAVSPDRKSIYITIVVEEGALWTIKSIHLSGETVLPPAVLLKKVPIRAGDVFSRKSLMDAEKIITDELGRKGYIFATVSPDPHQNLETHTVDLNLAVNPGKRIYVRQISFTDNIKTNDNVLRRELLQMEGAPVSSGQLEKSKTYLNRLPYIRDTRMTITPVEGREDQVDVNYAVTEGSPAEASFNISYGQLGGIGFGVGLNQKNFLGTGDTLGFNFSKNVYQQVYSIDFSNPYYTPEGVSRDIGLSVTRFNPHAANLTQSYSEDQYSLYVMYGIPVGQESGVTNRVQLGYGYEESKTRLSTNHAVFANTRTPGNAHTACNRCMFTNGNIVGNLDKIVYLRAVSDHCIANCTPINGTVCTNLNIIPNHNPTQLGNLVPHPLVFGNPKTITADHGT